jgi:hypothetical protein
VEAVSVFSIARRALWIGLVSFSALVLAGSATVGCSNQGEGARCDTLGDNAGNGECQDGLVCDPPSQLNGSFDNVGMTFGICCPGDRSLATTTICSIPASPVGADAAAPFQDSGSFGSDGGLPSPDATLDQFVADSNAPVDTGADVAADVSTDAAGE